MERLYSTNKNTIQVMCSKTAASISSEMFACKVEALAISFVTIMKGKGEITTVFQAGFLPFPLCNPTISAQKGVKAERRMNQATKT